MNCSIFLYFLLQFKGSDVIYSRFMVFRSNRFWAKVPVEKGHCMQDESFDLFAEKIITMPAKEILNALNLDCKILEEDLSRYRSSFTDDEYSILCFRQFIRSVKSGAGIFPRRCLPPDHLELYKHTVVRLVHEHELPSTAMDQFDGAFVVAAYS